VTIVSTLILQSKIYYYIFYINIIIIIINISKYNMNNAKNNYY